MLDSEFLARDLTRPYRVARAMKLVSYGVFAAWLLYDVSKSGKAMTVVAVPTRLYGGGFLREPINSRKPIVAEDSVEVLGRVIVWIPEQKGSHPNSGQGQRKGKRK